MNKENKKLAQERRAQEREKAARRKKRNDILGLWVPIVLIVAVVVVLIVAIVTSGSGNSDTDWMMEDTGQDYSYRDENGNEVVVSDWSEIDDDDVSLDTQEGRVVQNGDTVNIDYVGRVDGVAFAGGDTQGMGADLLIGSGMYIDGFEDAIIGHTVGETFDLTVTFPDPYLNDPSLSGKEAVFTTTINGIYD